MNSRQRVERFERERRIKQKRQRNGLQAEYLAVPCAPELPRRRNWRPQRAGEGGFFEGGALLAAGMTQPALPPVMCSDPSMSGEPARGGALGGGSSAKGMGTDGDARCDCFSAALVRSSSSGCGDQRPPAEPFGSAVLGLPGVAAAPMTSSRIGPVGLDAVQKTQPELLVRNTGAAFSFGCREGPS